MNTDGINLSPDPRRDKRREKRALLTKRLEDNMGQVDERLVLFYETLVAMETGIFKKWVAKIATGEFDEDKAILAHNKLVDSAAKMERIRFELHDRLKAELDSDHPDTEDVLAPKPDDNPKSTPEHRKVAEGLLSMLAQRAPRDPLRGSGTNG